VPGYVYFATTSAAPVHILAVEVEAQALLRCFQESVNALAPPLQNILEPFFKWDGAVHKICTMGSVTSTIIEFNFLVHKWGNVCHFSHTSMQLRIISQDFALVARFLFRNDGIKHHPLPNGCSTGTKWGEMRRNGAKGEMRRNEAK
jgi:hypothetical protein